MVFMCHWNCYILKCFECFVSRNINFVRFRVLLKSSRQYFWLWYYILYYKSSVRMLLFSHLGQKSPWHSYHSQVLHSNSVTNPKFKQIWSCQHNKLNFACPFKTVPNCPNKYIPPCRKSNVQTWRSSCTLNFFLPLIGQKQANF